MSLISDATSVKLTTDEMFCVLRSVSFFRKGDRNTSGVLEWNSVEEACNALMICNHTVIPSPGDRVPYVLRLAFSNANSSERRMTARSTNTTSATGAGSSPANGWHVGDSNVSNDKSGNAGLTVVTSASGDVAAKCEK